RKGGGTMTSAGVLAEHPATTTAVTADAERPDSGSGRATGEAAAVAALVPGSAIALRDAPDGRSLATLSPQTSLVPVAHDRGWVRVRAEGWVKESEVSPADPTHLEISAADLRADPDGARGKLVRWDVEVLAMQTADPLRKGLLPDEPYLLARGP